MRNLSSTLSRNDRLQRKHIWCALLIAPLLFVSSHTASAAPVADQLNLDNYKGKVVYIDFWASWCGPCKLSFPFMEQMLSAFHRTDFVIITVNMDHSRARADAFLYQQPTSNLPVIYDSTGAIAKRFGVKAMPTSIIVDKSGAVRFKHEGFFENQISAYEAHIWELLSETH